MNSVICLWQYDPDDKKHWTLVEAFPMREGYPTTTPANVSAREGGWNEWMHTTDNGEDFVEHMGRAVTIWDFGQGAQLLKFHPPQWVKWLSPEFVDKIKTLPNWYTFFAQGHALYFGTQKMAQKLLLKE